VPIIQQGGPAGRRGPSYGKTVYLYAKNGQLVAAKWPRKPIGKPSARVLKNREKFRQAQKLIPHIYHGDMLTAIEAVKDTFFLPRDLITAAIYGRTFSIALDGKEVLVPMAFYKDVSFSLDVFDPKTGSLLTRGKEFWEALPQGQPNQVLASQGPEEIPVWLNLLAQEEDVMLTSGNHTVTNTGALALQGTRFKPLFVVTVSAIYAALDKKTGGQYKAWIFLMDGDDIGAIVAEGPTLQPGGTGVTTLLWNLANKAVLVPGSDYCCAIVRVDGGDTTSVNIRNGAVPLQGWASVTLHGVFFGAFSAPAVGDTLSEQAATLPRFINLIYTI